VLQRTSVTILGLFCLLLTSHLSLADEGDSQDSQTPDHSYTRRFALFLSQGINMIALPLDARKIAGQPVGERLNASDLTVHLANSEDEQLATWVIRFDPTDGRFKAYLPSASSSAMDFEIQSGRGYLVNMLEAKEIQLEGMPWGTPIFEAPIGSELNPLSVSISPSDGNETDPWAFVVSGQIHQQMPLADQTQVQVTNQRSGQTVLASINQSRYTAVFVDANRQPVVSTGEHYQVTIVDPRIDPRSQIFRVETRQLRLAHLEADVELVASIPKESRLLPNFPNPFNPETWIPFELAQDDRVEITIYETSGQQVRNINVGYRPAGTYRSAGRAAYWDGKTEWGETASCGIYFYTLKTKHFMATRRMVILK
jgi:hypothetical protein